MCGSQGNIITKTCRMGVNFGRLGFISVIFLARPVKLCYFFCRGRTRVPLKAGITVIISEDMPTTNKRMGTALWKNVKRIYWLSKHPELSQCYIERRSTDILA